MRKWVKHIHFIGIGGSGMCGIAEVLINGGYQVSGSDIADGPAVQRLSSMGAQIAIGHSEANIEGADVVVVSTAIDQANPEVRAAQEAGITVIPRAEMLGELMRFQKGIAVAGTHGKTTTTSLVAAILIEAGLDPTFVVGGQVKGAGTNARLGAGEYLVAEADESDASFLRLKPEMAVVTNIDADHMQTYGGDFTKLKAAFIEFLQALPFYGLAIYCKDDDELVSILPEVHKPVLGYGFSNAAEIRGVDVTPCELGMRFSVQRTGKRDLQVELALPGKHNVLNALAAIAVADRLGIEDKHIVSALAGFAGIGRRSERLDDLQVKGAGSALLIDDYAHHPAELKVTIAAARGAWPDARVVTIFQPHRYTRTRDLLNDFARALSESDVLFVTEVYPAGETKIPDADGRGICKAIRSIGKVDPVFVEDINDLPQTIWPVLKDADVVLTLGAGSIGKLARDLPMAMEAMAAERQMGVST
ncbi:MAG: UDP-N-acetylmuramate--L-alanine ligase [Proteobacteria bacterium]|jgi:UDP-N-acetylmuramate--alanine ligase|nr:UDP-N-acetylmuramate--L-alanine ligase [Pseudomonadota bacterium]